MKERERLLIVAMEECAEMQQEISKALRFGIENHHPDEPHITNGERILREYNQLRAVMSLIIIKRVIKGMTETESSKIFREKIDSVEKWEEYSAKLTGGQQDRSVCEMCEAYMADEECDIKEECPAAGIVKHLKEAEEAIKAKEKIIKERDKTIRELKKNLSDSELKRSYMIDPMAIGDRHEMGG